MGGIGAAMGNNESETGCELGVCDADLHDRVDELEAESRHLNEMLNRLLVELCRLRQQYSGN